MPMKHKIAKLEDVAETLRGFYEAGADGAYYLQVEGMVPKAQVDEFRNNNITLTEENRQLKEKYKDIDPVKYTEYKAAAEKTPQAIEDAVKARVSAMKTEHETALNDVTGKLTVAQKQLSEVLVDGSLKSEAAKAGVLATALDDVVLRGRIVFSTVDGKLVAKNDKGEAMYDKDGVSPLSVGSWLKDLKKGAPHLFQGMQGGGGQGGAAGGGAFDMSKATTTQKIQAGLREMSANGG